MIFLLFVLFSSICACPPGFVVNPNGDKCFYAANGATASYMDAQRNCSALGGSLATIENAFDNSFVRSLVTGLYAYWIGLANIGTFGWTWLDGKALGYSNWQIGYPTKNDTCGMFDPFTGGWYSEPCVDLSGPYVCSAPLISAACTTPSTVAPPISATCPTSSTTCSATCPNGWTYNSQTQSCYVVMYKQNFIQAEMECQVSGAHLASIHSIQENAFVAKLASTGLALDFRNQVWIGVRRVGQYWVNNDGSTLDYVNWIPGHPFTNATNQNCVEIYADQDSKNGDYEDKWNDIDCETNLRAFVCKKSASK